MLPPTLRVPYQSDASSSPSSSPSSYSDLGPVVDISHGVFHSHLKTPFSQSLSIHSHLYLAQPYLLEFDHSVFSSHWRCVGECGILSPDGFGAHYNIVILTYLLNWVLGAKAPSFTYPVTGMNYSLNYGCRGQNDLISKHHHPGTMHGAEM